MLECAYQCHGNVMDKTIALICLMRRIARKKGHAARTNFSRYSLSQRKKRMFNL